MATMVTTTDLQNATGSDLDDDVLYAIIDNATNEANAYLKPKMLSVQNDGATQMAVLHLAIVGVIDRQRQDSEHPMHFTRGDWNQSEGSDPLQLIQYHRKVAMELLDLWVSSQTFLINLYQTPVLKVN